jgi:hypothetical protein
MTLTIDESTLITLLTDELQSQVHVGDILGKFNILDEGTPTGDYFTKAINSRIDDILATPEYQRAMLSIINYNLEAIIKTQLSENKDITTMIQNAVLDKLKLNKDNSK